MIAPYDWQHYLKMTAQSADKVPLQMIQLICVCLCASVCLAQNEMTRHTKSVPRASKSLPLLLLNVCYLIETI